MYLEKDNVFELFGQILENRRDPFTRPAPGGVEVDDHLHDGTRGERQHSRDKCADRVVEKMNCRPRDDLIPCTQRSHTYHV